MAVDLIWHSMSSPTCVSNSNMCGELLIKIQVLNSCKTDDDGKKYYENYYKALDTYVIMKI